VKICEALILSLIAKRATALLGLDNSLVAGPKEIVFANYFHETAALHHIARVVVDTCEHERAALFVQPFIQAVYGFNACGIY